ncbi:transmembrane and ubiquitin-like domain-containing protein 2 [Rana temporaria]|uniref:transmembrane and ubiquitin-like domain-containing protein 2 n=1 Tax=Rana temporaria TaxID=8407 RepID=UPI001AAD7E44|nr:transmembrane and ubiquitin-like domain-containing protein 2 [Rana temporaria]XP_040187296.1 transmembrane and ubiquitin-like domain-containing protein 2 [Rana temporaria]
MGMESPPPTMIEGLGDEVTVAVGLFILLLALVLAWLSTYVAEGSDPLLGSLMPAGRREPLLGLSNPVPPNPEAQRTVEPQAEKPEEGEQGQGGEQGADSESASLDQMLDIQGVPKRGQPVTAVSDTDEDLTEGEVDGVDISQEVTRRKVPPEERETEGDGGTKQQDHEWRKRTSKGQEQTQPEEEMITLRLKFLNETEEVALVRPDDTIGTLKSKYFPGQEPQMKLIYQGQLLHDSSQTLRSLHITDNCVIHCHRSQATVSSSPVGPESGGTSTEHTGLTPPIGNLMIPIFVVMLALIWYFRINYRQFFTAPATVSLCGVTVFFSFLVFGMYGR